MEWTEKQILETLRFIEASDYDEVRLETGNLKLHVRKSGAPASLSAADKDVVVAPAAEAPRPAVGNEPKPGIDAPDPLAITIPGGMIAIRAPMVGTFYRAPAPHLPPFVAEGARVSADDTVCLIEVMKLFNTIKAGKAGKIVRILAQNAATVKRDQVLMIIEPER